MKAKNSPVDPRVRLKVVCEELDICKTTAWRWEKEGKLPPQLDIGGWARSTIDKWKRDNGWPSEVQTSNGGEVAA